MRRTLLILLILSLGLFLYFGTAIASPFTPNVANDYYAIYQQGGAYNGTPTARDNNDGEPDINDAVNALLGTTYENNKDIDGLFFGEDSVWRDGTRQVALIGLTAANTNSLGYYTFNGGSINLSDYLLTGQGFGFDGSGTSSDPYKGTTFTVPEGMFGFYLFSDPVPGDNREYGEATYYSQSWRNPGDWDHMMTFKLDADVLNKMEIYVDFGMGNGPERVVFECPYLIAWEDLPAEYINGKWKLGDEDYDDMIFLVDKMTPQQSVPEPATMLLLGFGLVGLAAAGGRRFRRS